MGLGRTRTGARGRRLSLALLTAGLLVAGTGIATAAPRDFDNPASNDTSQQFGLTNVQRQDTPNDPDYDRAEPDDQDAVGDTNIYDEQFGLFGFASQRTRSSAVYATG